MANEHSLPHPIRLSSFLRFSSDIAYVISEEDDMALKKLVETKADKIMRRKSWRAVQELLEAETISKVSMKEYLNKLRSIAKELSGMTSMSLDDILVLILHLFLEEPENSLLLKRVMKHKFGSAASLIILHRIYKVILDIKEILPPYTLEYFKGKNRNVGKREEKFGNYTSFIPLNRLKIELPDVSHLNEIKLENIDQDAEWSLTEDTMNAKDELCQKQPSPDESFKEPVSEVQYFHHDCEYYEEINFHVNCNKFEELNFLLPVSQLSEVCQIAFKHAMTLNNVESIMYESLFSSNENIIINLPLVTDKTSIVFLAILTLVECSNYTTAFKSKVLYLMSSVQAVDLVATKLRRQLKSFNVIVNSVTDFTSVNKTDFKVPQLIVTTPTVWEMISQDMDHEVNSFKMLIIDEMNCLGEINGPALEVVIARMRKQAESNGIPLRMLGLTKSLLSLNCGPSFFEMAEYLEVKRNNMLVVSNQHPTILPRVSLVKMKAVNNDIHRKIYSTIVNNVICNNNDKVIVFVNGFEEVIQTADDMKKSIYRHQRNKLSLPAKVKNKMLVLMEGENTDKRSRELCSLGFLTIHSRMTAATRDYLRMLFKKGVGKLIVASSNYASLLSSLADTVIIKSTDVYDEESNTYVDVGVTDLAEMLATATYSCEDSNKTSPGNVMIIVSRNKLELYSTLLQNNALIESQLLYSLPDILNTEILLSGITNIITCERWFRYTYLYQRMKSRALVIDTVIDLDDEIHQLISGVLQTLAKAGIIRYKRSGIFALTEFGYIAHCQQIPYSTMEFLGKFARQLLNIRDILDVLCKAPLLSSIQVQARDGELRSLQSKFCKYLPNDKNNRNFQINVLLQSYLSAAEVSPSLRLAQDFIVKKTKKVARAMFEVSLNKRNFQMTEKCLDMAKMVENGCWKMRDDIIAELPKIQFEAFLQPVSNSVIQVNFFVTPDFRWIKDVYGDALLFWIWIVDERNNFICNYTCFRLTKQLVEKKTYLEFSLPVKAVVPLPTQYTTYVVSDKYLGVSHSCIVKFDHLSFPDDHVRVTERLELQQLPVAVLQNTSLEELYKFHHFSNIITHIFHSLYHSDHSVLITCSSDTDRIIAAEIAIFRVMCHKSGSKVVYLTQWKTEVEDRIISWKNMFKGLGWKLSAFSGKTERDIEDFLNADIIVATVHHWELASRSREIRKSLTSAEVGLIIMNDFQVFDANMETCFLRMAEMTSRDKVRLICLSQTALATIDDIACLLRISLETPNSLYNFVSPTNIESAMKVEVIGFSERHCDAAMDQVLWDLTSERLPPDEVAVVLVPSKNDVVKTATVLKNAVLKYHNPNVWRNISEDLCITQDVNVGLMLKCGIGFLHSGMSEYDCDIVKTYVHLHAARILIVSTDVADFIRQKIHLLIVKGTEMSDTKKENFNIPVSELASTMYSCSSYWQEAFIFTHESKKILYKSYFEGGLSLESHLLPVLPEHVNNEIVAGAIKTKEAAVKHLSQSFLGHRLAKNPCYYLGLLSEEESQDYVAALVDKSLLSLQSAGCIREDSGFLQATILGSLVSSYNLSHTTLKHLNTNLNPVMNQKEIVLMMCKCEEFKFLSKRDEDNELVKELQKCSRWTMDHLSHTVSPVELKVFLLLRSHFSKFENHLSILFEYKSDVRRIVDTSCRIMQAIVIICCDRGWLISGLQAQLLLQMLESGNWGHGREPIFTLPHITRSNWKLLIPRNRKIMGYLPEIQALYCGNHSGLFLALKNQFHIEEINEIHKALQNLPLINIQCGVYGKTKFWLIKEFYENVFGERISLISGKEYTLSIILRESDSNHESSWTLIMGYQEKQEVLAMKKVKSRNSESLLTFKTPTETGEVTYTLYVMSNTHVGLDQQFDVHFKIVT